MKKPKYRITYNQGANRLWYYRLVSIKNGQTLLDGGEGYHSAGNCRRAIRQLKLIDLSLLEVVNLSTQ